MRLLSLSLAFSLLPTTIAHPHPSTNDLSPRANDAPGIGVELEWRAGIIINNDPRASAAKSNKAAIEKIKGSTIKVKGQSTFTNEWKLTAEHSPDIDFSGLKTLLYEWIVLGEVVKLKQDEEVLPKIAKEITDGLVGSHFVPIRQNSSM